MSASRLTRRRLIAGGLASAAGLAARAADAGAPGIPVLTYHRFSATYVGSTTVRMRRFLAQLRWLASTRRPITPLRDAMAVLGADAASPIRRQAVITADDGFVTVYDRLYPLVLERRFPVTLFIYPAAISTDSDAMTWAQLAEMQRSGLVDVQSHTYGHPDFRTERHKRSEGAYAAFVDDEMTRSRQILEAKLGKSVDLLAWPYGVFDPMLEAAARRAGYAAAFAFNGGLMRPGSDRFAVPRIPALDADQGAGLERLMTSLGPRDGRPVAVGALQGGPRKRLAAPQAN